MVHAVDEGIQQGQLINLSLRSFDATIFRMIGSMNVVLIQYIMFNPQQFP